MKRYYYVYDWSCRETMTEYEDVICPECGSDETYELEESEQLGEPWEDIYIYKVKCDKCNHEFNVTCGETFPINED